MKHSIFQGSILLAFMFLYPGAANAQDTVHKKMPSVVLVQLPSERNRIEALKKQHEERLLAEVRMDAVCERTAMIRDFQANFTYCPVYYFMDTNATLIKKRVFTGVLMNADGTPATNIPLSPGSTGYVIAYYGYLAPVYQHQSMEDSMRDRLNVEPPFGRGLVILNDKFQELTFFYKLGYDDVLFGLKKKHPELRYSSKHFDIEYYPFVKLFELKLTDKQGRPEFWDNYSLYTDEPDSTADTKKK